MQQLVARITIQRENHPYDIGYWARYDGKPRPPDGDKTRALERDGWDTCNAELDFEMRELNPNQ